jgi:dihydroorotate dehydrogenase electron transfer subunit
MKYHEVTLQEAVALQPFNRKSSAAGALIRFEEDIIVQPGQYFQVWRGVDESPLPQIAFAASLPTEKLMLLDRIPGNWNPGESLHLWGPMGKGFSLPEGVHFVSMVVPEGDPVRLLPLMTQALGQNASVSLFLDDPEGSLISAVPVEVEVQPLAALPEALMWADFLVMDISAVNLPQLKAILGLDDNNRRKVCPGQVLIRTSMPCAGVGDCRVCAVETRRGLKMACKDGPVFKLEDIIYVV